VTGFHSHFFFVLFRNLPAKSSLEAEKHRRQYEQMVEAAKKKGTQHGHSLVSVSQLC